MSDESVGPILALLLKRRDAQDQADLGEPEPDDDKDQDSDTAFAAAAKQMMDAIHSRDLDSFTDGLSVAIQSAPDDDDDSSGSSIDDLGRSTP